MPPKANTKIRSVRTELITWGPYDGHTNITMLKDGCRDYPNVPEVNVIDTF